MTISEVKNFYKKGQITKESLKRYIDDGKFTREELVREGVLTEDELQNLYKVSKQEMIANMRAGMYDFQQLERFVREGDIDTGVFVQHLKESIRERKLSQDDIRRYINSGQLDKNELIREGVVSQDEMDEIFDVPLAPINVGFDSWDKVPDLVPGRVDAFVLGTPGAGKSVFMAGLLHYARQNGNLRQGSGHIMGMEYVFALTDAIKIRRLPPATPADYMQYMACDLKNEDGEYVPMTFIEMSGETFRRCFGKSMEQWPSKFVNYLQDENRKLIVFVIDYNRDVYAGGSEIHQSSYLDFSLTMFKQSGTLDNTVGILILITKWDQSPDQSDAAAQAFLDENYKNLLEGCKEIEEEMGIPFEILAFSLGTFHRRNSYEYNPEYSETVYDWITSNIPPAKPQKKGGFLGFFKKRN